MKRTRITVNELCTAGGITKQAVYQSIRGGKLTFKDGAADVLKLLAEWNAKRDYARPDRLGPVLLKIIASRGLEMPAAVKTKPSSASKEPAVVNASGAPDHLSVEMRRFWRRVVSEYELESDALLILRTACESFDRAQEARILIAKEGMVLVNRPHPAINIEQQSQRVFLSAMRQLGLDIDSPGPVGRPPGR
jgi:phage terminase small subunit